MEGQGQGLDYPLVPLKGWKRKIQLQGHRLLSPWTLFTIHYSLLSKPQETSQPLAATVKITPSFISSSRPLFLPADPMLCWASLPGWLTTQLWIQLNSLLLAISPDWGSHSCLTQWKAPWPTPVTLDSLLLRAHPWDMTEEVRSVSPGLSRSPSPSPTGIPVLTSRLTCYPRPWPPSHRAHLEFLLKHNMIRSITCCKFPIFHTGFELKFRLPSSAPKTQHPQGLPYTTLPLVQTATLSALMTL